VVRAQTALHRAPVALFRLGNDAEYNGSSDHLSSGVSFWKHDLVDSLPADPQPPCYFHRFNSL